MYSTTAQAMLRPSNVLVPRPISSRMISESAVALRRMFAVSLISTMKVLWPPGQIVRRADAGEDAVDDADRRAVRGHEAADLRQGDDLRHLPHIGAFARHVGAGHDQHAVLVGVHQRIVGNERLVREHALDDRVAAVLDIKNAVLA